MFASIPDPFRTALLQQAQAAQSLSQAAVRFQKELMALQWQATIDAHAAAVAALAPTPTDS